MFLKKNYPYRERVASLEGSDIFLQAAGFISTTDENQENEEFWVFPPEADSTGVHILQKEWNLCAELFGVAVF